MKTAIHFGAGNIGRGFIGMLLSQAGYKVIFADIQEDIVAALKQQNQYLVEVVGDEKKIISVQNVDAIHSSDPQLIDMIASADIVTTAVGPNILPLIAPIIAKAIEQSIQKGRDHHLNIIACENAVRATTKLQEYIQKNMSHPLPSYTHFIDAAVDRIVPPMEDDKDILKVRVEDFYEWLVEKSAFSGDIPDIAGMTLVDDLEAGIERKLFTLNTGHAVCAWIGQYLGFNTIGEAINDPKVRNIVDATMKQSGDALIKKHGFDKDMHHAYINKILKRFANPYIIDDVERVGRQPIRKLSQGERIASPIQTALHYALPIDKLLIGAAAAMHFKNDTDPEVLELQKMIKEISAYQTFKQLSKISSSDISIFEDMYMDLAKFLNETTR